MKKILILGLLGLAMGCQKPPNPSAGISPHTPAASTPVAAPTGGEMMIGAQQPDVQIDKETYFPGEEIQVTAVATGLSDSAWVGVVPAEIPHGKEQDNDAADLGYFYLSSGKSSLVAPREPGEYDVRLNSDDDQGQEVASRSFRVVEDPKPVSVPAILWKPEGPVGPGSQIEVAFEAPLSLPEDAWIGVIASGVPHGSEQTNDEVDSDFSYLEGRTRGVVRLQVPPDPGSYDVRMFDTDNGKEVGSVTFQVAEGAATKTDPVPALTPTE